MFLKPVTVVEYYEGQLKFCLDDHWSSIDGQQHQQYCQSTNWRSLSACSRLGEFFFHVCNIKCLIFNACFICRLAFNLIFVDSDNKSPSMLYNFLWLLLRVLQLLLLVFMNQVIFSEACDCQSLHVHAFLNPKLGVIRDWRTLLSSNWETCGSWIEEHVVNRLINLESSD